MAGQVAALMHDALAGWTPVRIARHEDRVDWALLDGPPRSPFFEQDADAAMRHPFNAAFARVTALAALDETFGERPRPCGLIFHWSRSGSTLAAQMAAELGTMTVLSEAQPIDALLKRVDDETIAASRLRAFADRAAHSAGTSRYIIKCAPWQLLRLPVFTRAFPDVPAVFLFREPQAILASSDRSSGADAFAGEIDPALLGVDEDRSRELSAARYLEVLLTAIAERALAEPHDRMLFVGYDELPGAVVTRILPHFGIAPSEPERARLDAASQRDAKRPDRRFIAEPPRASSKGERAAGDAPAAALDRLYRKLRVRSGVAL